MGALRALIALAGVAAASTAAAEPMRPRSEVGWSLGLATVHVEPAPADFGSRLSLHLGRGWRGLVWRAEASAIAAPGSSLTLTLGGAVRAPLAETLSCGFKCATWGIYADAGAGWLANLGADARAGAAYGMAGVALGMAMTPQTTPPWKPWFRSAFFARVYVLDGGTSIAGGLELTWMR